MADYEAGLRAAVRLELPETAVFGCWFHFIQAVIRKAKKLNLWNLNEPTTNIIKMAISLPLLPERFIGDAINQIQGEK